jgi:hypothetical protein
VAIVGECRIGKSSLLWHIAQREVAERDLTDAEQYVFLFLGGKGQQHLNADEGTIQDEEGQKAFNNTTFSVITKYTVDIGGNR